MLQLIFVVPFVSAQTDAASSLEEAERSIVIGDPFTEEIPPGETPGRTASAGLILRMLIVLVVIALAVYGVVFFMKKVSRPPARTDPNLKVLSTAGLGTGRFVHVVSVGDRAWLIGSSETAVSLISEITDQSVISAMLAEQSRQNSGGQGRLPDFKNLLLRMGIQSPRPPGAENIRKRRERFKGL